MTVPGGPRVPDPVAADAADGRPPVRGAEIALGIGMGLGGSWLLRVVLWQAFLPARGIEYPEVLVPLLVPTALLVAGIAAAFVTGRRGWALGMLIYLGAGAILLGPLFFLTTAFAALCGPPH